MKSFPFVFLVPILVSQTIFVCAKVHLICHLLPSILGPPVTHYFQTEFALFQLVSHVLQEQIHLFYWIWIFPFALYLWPAYHTELIIYFYPSLVKIHWFVSSFLPSRWTFLFLLQLYESSYQTLIQHVPFVFHKQFVGFLGGSLMDKYLLLTYLLINAFHSSHYSFLWLVQWDFHESRLLLLPQQTEHCRHYRPQNSDSRM